MYSVKSGLLIASLTLLFAFIGFSVFGVTGALLALALVAALNWMSATRARELLLWMHRARKLHRWEAPNLFRTAEELATRAGIAMPSLMVYPSEIPNAFALAARNSEPVVATSGSLLQLLDPREVRAVLAHEFAHLKNRDSTLNWSAGIMVHAITAVSQGFFLLFLLMLLTGGISQPSQALFPTLMLVAAAPTVATLLHAALMRTRERLADRVAAELTGDPRGLATALHRLQQYSRFLRGWLRRFRFIYTAENDRGWKWLQSHPSTAERVNALLAMERESVAHLRPGVAG